MSYIYLPITVGILLLTYGLAIWKPNIRQPLIYANTAVCIIYLLYRITVIPRQGLISISLGILLFIAELIGFVQFFNFQFLFLHPYDLKHKDMSVFTDVPPFVDILICTYNEPVELVRKTLAAAMLMEYPKDRFLVHVCDDGRREAMKQMVESFGASYIQRSDNKGAKAGNINHAIQQVHGDLFAVLDADMIPKPDFLSCTIPYFSDSQMSYVQTPQVYYNQDMYQYNFFSQVPNEQDFFMRSIQVARAAVGAVLHIGTNVVFRRDLVLQIGGYPTFSITEDMAVGLQLQALGYKSEFINKELVYGLSATTYKDCVTQRDRWCRGNLQVVRHFNPLKQKGLSFAQKLTYLDGVIYWLLSLQKMVFILCPLFYMLTGIPVIHSTLNVILLFFIPFILGEYFVFKVLAKNTRSLIWSHFYEISMAPHISMSILKEWFRVPTIFQVTKKDVVSNKDYFQFSMGLPHLFFSILTIIAWAYGGYAYQNQLSPPGAFFLNVIWSAYNFVGMMVSLRVSLQKPIFRKSERVQITDVVPIFVNDGKKDVIGILYDLTEKGVGILCKQITADLNASVIIQIPAYQIQVNGKISRNQNKFLGIEFDTMNKEEYLSIIRLYVEYLTTFYSPLPQQQSSTV